MQLPGMNENENEAPSGNYDLSTDRIWEAVGEFIAMGEVQLSVLVLLYMWLF